MNILIETLDKYILNLLELHKLNDAKGLTTTGTSLTKRPHDGDEELELDDKKLYRRATGKLMWLTTIRPDIAYAT